MQILLTPRAGVPLHRQLYRALREAILSGRLPPGGRVPSTRALAADLRVSRNTALAAVEQLAAEGYVTGRVGSGTKVAEALPVVGDGRRAAEVRAGAGAIPLSARGEALAAQVVAPPWSGRPPRPFRPGTPAIDALPLAVWGRIAARRWRGVRRDMLGYGDPGGFEPLRAAIAHYAGGSRGVRCDPAQVVIVSGSQQALDLAARLLVDPGDAVWMEDPGYRGARGALAGAGARLVDVPVDEDGLDVEAGVRRAPGARAAYVTPSHQFPTGATLSLARRLALLEWARAARAWILEDDYDSEFRFHGRPLASLQGLDASRVVYVGTFSKVLFPALRLGYVIVPPALVEPFARARAIADRHSPTLEQAVLAEFIDGGHFARHVRRMRRLYAERQAQLLAAAAGALPDWVEARPTAGGLHLVAWLPPGVDDRAAAAAAAREGVEAPPLSIYAAATPPRGGLLLGYAAFDGPAMRRGMTRLAHALATVAPPRREGARRRRRADGRS